MCEVNGSPFYWKFKIHFLCMCNCINIYVFMCIYFMLILKRGHGKSIKFWIFNLLYNMCSVKKLVYFLFELLLAKKCINVRCGFNIPNPSLLILFCKILDVDLYSIKKINKALKDKWFFFILHRLCNNHMIKFFIIMLVKLIKLYFAGNWNFARSQL